MVKRLDCDLNFKHSKGRRVISRRLSDRRLWQNIEDYGLQKAAYCLTRGYAFLCWGGNTRAVIWREVRGAYVEPYSNFSDETLAFLSRCKHDYLRWCAHCEAYNLNYRAVMDVLYFGKSLSDVDKSHGRRHGWGHRTVIEALLLYRK